MYVRVERERERRKEGSVHARNRYAHILAHTHTHSHSFPALHTHCPLAADFANLGAQVKAIDEAGECVWGGARDVLS